MRLLTSSWALLWRFSEYELPVQPVRTSRGIPRFWPEASAFPAVEELMPDGWMFGIKDMEKFDRCYRRKLHVLGVERIKARLHRLNVECGKPLALACFEARPHECHRGQFSAWWLRKTGVVVPELGLLSNRRHPVLCSEVGERREQV
jgi:hypothetical protein